MEFLFPAHFFEGSATWLLLVLLVVTIIGLVWGAERLVDGSVGLAQRLGIPKIIIGATIVSLGTTSAEVAVSVLAALRGSHDIALGNAVGSIICDTGLIFGLCCVMTRLPIDRFVLNRHGWIQFGSGVALVLIALIGWNAASGLHQIPRWAGFLFLGLLGVYLWISVVWARQHGAATGEAATAEAGAAGPMIVARPAWVESGWMVFGLLIVLLASHVLVECVKELCQRWGVPPSIIASTVVAFGTSLPELVTAITSIRKGHPELVVGNIIGADILNVLFVTGAAASTASLDVDPTFFKLHFPAMLAVLVVFRIMIGFSHKTFVRWPGGVLLLIFVAYLVGNYFLGVA